MHGITHMETENDTEKSNWDLVLEFEMIALIPGVLDDILGTGPYYKKSVY